MIRIADKEAAPANGHEPVLDTLDDPGAVAMIVAWVNGQPVARMVTVQDDVPGHIVTTVTPSRRDR